VQLAVLRDHRGGEVAHVVELTQLMSYPREHLLDGRANLGLRVGDHAHDRNADGARKLLDGRQQANQRCLRARAHRQGGQGDTTDQVANEPHGLVILDRLGPIQRQDDGLVALDLLDHCGILQRRARNQGAVHLVEGLDLAIGDDEPGKVLGKAASDLGARQLVAEAHLADARDHIVAMSLLLGSQSELLRRVNGLESKRAATVVAVDDLAGDTAKAIQYVEVSSGRVELVPLSFAAGETRPICFWLPEKEMGRLGIVDWERHETRYHVSRPSVPAHEEALRAHAICASPG